MQAISKWKAKVTTVPGDQSCSTEDKPSTDTRLTEDEMTTLLSAVAGTSIVHLENPPMGEFLVTATRNTLAPIYAKIRRQQRLSESKRISKPLPDKTFYSELEEDKN